MILPVCVRFPVLQVKYYNEHWLACDKIRRIIKVVGLVVLRGKFARVCMEIEPNKPLKAGYRMYGVEWRIQYNGLQNICFKCGRYGH